MENDASSERKKDRSSRYFGIGAIFLLAMALCWAVDTSLTYIFLGLAAYFVFLGFYNSPSRTTGSRPGRRSYEPDANASGAGPSFSDGLKNIFSRKTTFTQGKTQAGPLQSRRRMLQIFLAVFFVIFMAPIVVSMFGGSDTEDAVNYFSLAERQYTANQYDSAYQNYRQAMTLNPEYKEAMVGYGKILMMRNNRDSAIVMFDKALRIDPGFQEAVYNKALIYYNQKKYNEGVEMMVPLLEDNPDYYQGMLLMGDFYYALNKYEDAMPWYEKAYQDGGMRGSILCEIMGYIYETRGNTEKAIEFYKEALTYDDTMTGVYERLGELLPGEDGNVYRVKAGQMKQK